MYLCNACDREFDEPYVRSYVENHEFWGEAVSRTMHEDECPFCNSDDIEKIEPAEEEESDEQVET